LQFQLASYAKDYFATHRRGFFLFRRKVPLTEMLRFSPVRPLPSSLLLVR
jgi:hypothetical protein